MVNTKKRSSTIFIVIGFLLCFGLIAFLGMKVLEKPKTPQKSTNLVVDTSAENVRKGKEELANRKVYFYGIMDGSMSKDAPLALQNPEVNQDILIKYTIINDVTGETVFESDLIESGKAIQWYPGETLNAGVYNFTVIEEPYYQATGSDAYLPLTVGNNHVVIELIED